MDVFHREVTQFDGGIGRKGGKGWGRRGCYAEALYADANATLGDLREAVTTFEDLARIARRTLGGAHPLTAQIEQSLQYAREDLRLRTP